MKTDLSSSLGLRSLLHIISSHTLSLDSLSLLINLIVAPKEIDIIFIGRFLLLLCSSSSRTDECLTSGT